MGEHELLLRHAEQWAQTKKRPLTRDLVETVLDLRHHMDETSAVSWPAGSVERLLLVIWPAYGGADVPDSADLLASLDAYWRFLRATGRLASGSAEPAALLKEAKRAIPKMAAASADPARHSQARVLQDFGRSIGISLDNAQSIEELQQRVDSIASAFNALPFDERGRLMPDPSPKGFAAQRMTALGNDVLRRSAWSVTSDATIVADQARRAPYVQACLALAEWVGDGREVTGIGVLRPAVAREAFDALDLWTWEKRWTPPSQRLQIETDDDEVARAVDDSLREATRAFRSATHCRSLSRLWEACEGSELIEISSRRAVRTPDLPSTAEDWVELGVELVVELAMAVDFGPIEPIIDLFAQLVAHPDGAATLAELDAHWMATLRVPVDPEMDTVLRKYWQGRLEEGMTLFEPTGVWVIDSGTLRLTDFGRVCALAMLDAYDAGYFDDENWADDPDDWDDSDD